MWRGGGEPPGSEQPAGGSRLGVNRRLSENHVGSCKKYNCLALRLEPVGGSSVLCHL